MRPLHSVFSALSPYPFLPANQRPARLLLAPSPARLRQEGRHLSHTSSAPCLIPPTPPLTPRYQPPSRSSHRSVASHALVSRCSQLLLRCGAAMFTLLCCADLAGEKVNLEITLSDFPVTLDHLLDHLARTFAREAAELAALDGSAHAAPDTLHIMSVFVYDDAQLHWARLTSLAQLHEYDQLYVFQPQTGRNRDVQRDLPPPRPPIQPSPAPRHSTRPSSPRAALSELGAGARSEAAPRTFTATPAASYAGPTRSPVREQLEAQRREESLLAERLSTVRSARERLEREALLEEEEERRRLAAETDRRLRHTEADIWAQREALAKAEAEFQRLLAEKQRLLAHSSTS